MKTILFILCSCLLLACKKDKIENIPDPVLTNNPGVDSIKIIDSLKKFSISVVDSTISSAKIAWTNAGDTTKTIYSVFLDDKKVASNVTVRNFEFINLQANRAYSARVVAYNSKNDSTFSTIQFKTKDEYLKFARQLPAEIGTVYGMALTPENGYIFVYRGRSDITYFGDGKPSTATIRVMTLDSLGNVQWSRKYDYQWQDPNSARIKNTTDGYIIMTARGLIKIDFKGNVLWTYLLNIPNYQVFNSFLEAQNGDFIITGVQLPPLSSFLIRLNSKGQLLWKSDYPVDDAYHTVADVVEIPSENSFVVLGTSNSSKYGLWKVNGTGEKLWKISFGDTLTNGIPTFLKVAGNQILASGSTVGDYYLHTLQMFRFDFNGVLQQSKSFTQPHFGDGINSHELTRDGGSIVLANIGTSEGPFYTKLFKLDRQDNKQWEVAYPGLEPCYMICETYDKGYAFVGYSRYHQASFLVKTNPSGEL